MTAKQIPTIQSDRLLTDVEASEILNVCRATVWNRVKDGTLPAPIKLGRSRRFPLSQINAFIQASIAKSAA